MRVKDLISDATWVPGFSYNEKQKVSVSFIMPVYSKKNGLLEKAVHSVLSLDIPDLELIFVDDDSIDGTSEFIAETMKQDGRVSCIKHAQNVGLPAISEWEGILKARGEYIAFAFDDVIFEPTGILKLLQIAKDGQHKFVHGFMRIYFNDPVLGMTYFEHCRPGTKDYSFDKLQSLNTIAQSSILIHRSVFDEVGCFDPHIAIARVCDWDLWQRVSKKFPLNAHDIFVASEYGPTQSLSLGNSYLYDYFAVHEYERQYRDIALRPENYGDWDVIAHDPVNDVIVSDFTVQCIEKLQAKMSWLKNYNTNMGEERILVLNKSFAENKKIFSDNQGQFPKALDFVYVEDNCVVIPKIMISSAIIVSQELAVNFINNFYLDAANRVHIPVFILVSDARGVGILKAHQKEWRGAVITTPEAWDLMAKVELNTPLIKIRVDADMTSSKITAEIMTRASKVNQGLIARRWYLYTNIDFINQFFKILPADLSQVHFAIKHILFVIKYVVTFKMKKISSRRAIINTLNHYPWFRRIKPVIRKFVRP